MTLADPSKQWKGFKPIDYWLDIERVMSLPLVRVNGEELVQVNGVEQPTTIGEVLKRLEGHEIKRAEGGVLDAEVETNEGTVTFKGIGFNRHVLVLLLGLKKEGISPYLTEWFWFDKNHSRHDVQESYSFFVVGVIEDKIVREHIRFFDAPRDGFDPSIFTADEASIWDWEDDSSWEDARIRYWYRKFYEETQTGQLMCLRRDKPTLHYYAQGKEEDIRSLLSKIHMLLWVLVVVTVLLLLLRR